MSEDGNDIETISSIRREKGPRTLVFRPTTVCRRTPSTPPHLDLSQVVGRGSQGVPTVDGTSWEKGVVPP